MLKVEEECVPSRSDGARDLPATKEGVKREINSGQNDKCNG